MRAVSKGLSSTIVFIALCLTVANCSGGSDADTRAQQKQQPRPTPAPNSDARNSMRGSGALLTGRDALGDWTTDVPGIRRRITTADLPKLFETRSVDNGPRLVSRPADA